MYLTIAQTRRSATACAYMKHSRRARSQLCAISIQSVSFFPEVMPLPIEPSVIFFIYSAIEGHNSESLCVIHVAESTSSNPNNIG